MLFDASFLFLSEFLQAQMNDLLSHVFIMSGLFNNATFPWDSNEDVQKDLDNKATRLAVAAYGLSFRQDSHTWVNNLMSVLVTNRYRYTHTFTEKL